MTKLQAGRRMVDPLAPGLAGLLPIADIARSLFFCILPIANAFLAYSGHKWYSLVLA